MNRKRHSLVTGEPVISMSRGVGYHSGPPQHARSGRPRLTHDWLRTDSRLTQNRLRTDWGLNQTDSEQTQYWYWFDLDWLLFGLFIDQTTISQQLLYEQPQSTVTWQEHTLALCRHLIDSWSSGHVVACDANTHRHTHTSTHQTVLYSACTYIRTNEWTQQCDFTNNPFMPFI